MPSRCCRARISRRISTRSWASRLESGSSMRHTGASATIARPSATRCCWPPESCEGLRSSSLPSPRRSAARCRRAARSSAGTPPHLQTEDDVLGDRKVREEGIGLEHHRHLTLRGCKACDILAADQDRAGRDALQPGDESQRGRFSATRGPEQRAEAALPHDEAHAIDGGFRAPPFGDRPQFHFRQDAPPSLRPSGPAIGA